MLSHIGRGNGALAVESEVTLQEAITIDAYGDAQLNIYRKIIRN